MTTEFSHRQPTRSQQSAKCRFRRTLRSLTLEWLEERQLLSAVGISDLAEEPALQTDAIQVCCSSVALESANLESANLESVNLESSTLEEETTKELIAALATNTSESSGIGTVTSEISTVLTSFSGQTSALNVTASQDSTGLSTMADEPSTPTTKTKLDTPVFDVIPTEAPTEDYTSVVYVSVEPVENADCYTVFFFLNPEQTGEFVYATFTETEKLVRKLSPDTEYYATIVARDTTGNYATSDFADYIVFSTYPITLPSPELSVQLVGKNSASVTIGEVLKADSYELQYSTSFTFPRTTTTTVTYDTAGTYQIDNLAPNKTWYFQVKAIGEVGYTDSEYSDYAQIKTQRIPLETPTLSVHREGQNQALIQIGAVDHAISYTLEYSTDSQFSTVTSISYSDAGVQELLDLQYGTTYYFRLKAIPLNDYTESAYTATETITTLAATVLSEPKLQVTGTESDSISLAITQVSHAIGYVVEYSTRSDFSNKQTLSTESLQCELTDLSVNTLYYIRAYAIAESGYSDSAFSDVLEIKTRKLVLDTPTGLAISDVTHRSAVVSFNAVEDAARYQIQYSTDATFAQDVQEQSVTATSVTLSSLKDDTTYYVRVKAIGDGHYGDSAYSKVESFETSVMPMPVITSLTSEGEHVYVSWLDIGASTYNVRYQFQNAEVLDGTSSWVTLSGLTGTSVSFDLIYGTTVYVQVQDPIDQCWTTSVSCTLETPDWSTWTYTLSDEAATELNVFQLHSNPNSQKVLYLDFTGHLIIDTAWNTAYNRELIVTPSVITDGYFDAEDIYRIWQTVAEDYAPFDVDVTTEFPSLEVLAGTPESGGKYGHRMAIGGKSETLLGIKTGGMSYVDVFDWAGFDYDTSFVFPQNLSGKASYVAESTAHEAGHSMGLHHDGYPGDEYYPGANGWGAIMGGAYGQKLVQWSKGEYPDATCYEDDLVILDEMLDYKDDDHATYVGGQLEGAPSLLVDDRGAATLTTQVFGSGLIERNTDNDVFLLELNSGSVDLTLCGVDSYGELFGEEGSRSDLDIKAVLYDAAWNVLASYDSTIAGASRNVTARIQTEISKAGSYYLVVSGDGLGTPDDQGVYASGEYSNYGSLGRYAITGTVTKNAVWAGPTLSLVSVDTQSVKVSFTKLEDTEYYRLEYATKSDFSNAQSLVLETAGTVQLSNFAPNTTVYLRVLAVNTSGESSAWSETLVAATEKLPLEAPTLNPLELSGSAIAVSWSTVENASAYLVEYKTEFATQWSSKTVSLETTSTTIVGISGETYSVRVRALGSGEYAHSDYSDTLQIAVPITEFVRLRVVDPNQQERDWVDEWMNIGVQIQVYLCAGEVLDTFAAKLEYDPALFIPAEDTSKTGSFQISLQDLHLTTEQAGFVTVTTVAMKAQGGVALGTEIGTLGSASLQLALTDIQKPGQTTQTTAFSPAKNALPTVYAVLYDLDDDGGIRLNDLLTFSKVYNQQSSASLTAYHCDFDNNGAVQLNDLLLLAKNYSLQVGDSISFDAQFPWSSSTLTLTPATFEPTSTASTLTQNQLNTIVKSAMSQISTQYSAYFPTTALQNTTFQIADLSGSTLATQQGNVVWIDTTAAGYGWYIDTTPDTSTEAEELELQTSMRADLLSVVMHELGKVAGLEDTEVGFMQSELSLGVRRLPSVLDQIFGES